MNELKLFENEEFGKIRTTTINNEPYFVGRDICEIFGDTNYRRSLERLDEDEKGVSQIDTPGGKQNMTIVNESGLYSLLFYMQPQKAKGVSQNDTLINERISKLKKFKHWVTSEVLPTIHKTGGYVNNDDLFINTYMPHADEQTKAIFRSTLENVRSLNAKIERDKPKVLFADAVETSETSILIGDLAKLLKQNGMNIGQKRLFERLRNEGYLIKSGSSRNMPTQKAMDRGLFWVKERTINNPDGSVNISRTTAVTGKGQTYFVNKYLSELKN